MKKICVDNYYIEPGTLIHLRPQRYYFLSWHTEVNNSPLLLNFINNNYIRFVVFKSYTNRDLSIPIYFIQTILGSTYSAWDMIEPLIRALKWQILKICNYNFRICFIILCSIYSRKILKFIMLYFAAY